MFIHPAFLQIFNQLQLEGLVFKDLLPFLGGDDLALEGMIALDDAAHALFNLFQVFRGQRAGQVEVVIESVLDRRPDGHLAAWKFIQHRFRHHVRGRMPHPVKMGLFVLFFLFVCHFNLQFN